MLIKIVYEPSDDRGASRSTRHRFPVTFPKAKLAKRPNRTSSKRSRSISTTMMKSHCRKAPSSKKSRSDRTSGLPRPPCRGLRDQSGSANLTGKRIGEILDAEDAAARRFPLAAVVFEKQELRSKNAPVFTLLFIAGFLSQIAPTSWRKTRLGQPTHFCPSWARNKMADHSPF